MWGRVAMSKIIKKAKSSKIKKANFLQKFVKITIQAGGPRYSRF